MLDKQKHFYEL